MDKKVLETQKWLNVTYGAVPGFDKAPEYGNTGWPTITSLIEALQYELKIPSLTGEFGPATLAACPTLSQNLTAKENNIVKILQGSMWCKGYDCDDLSGIFSVRTYNGISQLQDDMGIVVNGIVTPHIFKSLLNMDAFVLVTENSFIREFQQYFNSKYVAHNDGNYIPCDGRSGREFTAAVSYVAQALEGFSTTDSTGFFGNTTAANFPQLSIGSTSEFVYPLQAALSANGKKVGPKSKLISDRISLSIKEFQAFMSLPIDGIADGKFMQNLLISTGDSLRDVDGCDSAMPIDADRLNSLVYYNYHYIGRYITSGQFSWGNKQLTKDEISLILNGGLRIFPIFQTSADSAGYFTYQQGSADGGQAIEYAKSLGIPTGTIIYFAVDYDFMDGELQSTVIPYFDAINNKFYGGSNKNSKKYRIGVYSSRNTCSKVSRFTSASFVSGMSTGYSGNLGFSMPNNWAFNQILGVNFLSIDNDAVSGLDRGFGKEEYTSESAITDSINSSFLSQLKTVFDLALQYTNGNVKNSNEITTMYFRHKAYYGSSWDLTAGEIDQSFCDKVDIKLNYHRIIDFYDPINGYSVGIEHLMASLNALLHDLLDHDWTPFAKQVGQFASWAGDLTTLSADIKARKADEYPELTLEDIGNLLLGTPQEYKSSFSLQDYMGDLDAYNLYAETKGGKKDIYTAFKLYYSALSGNCSRKRTGNWIANQYDGSEVTCQMDIIQCMTSTTLVYTNLRKMILKSDGFTILPDQSHYVAAEICMNQFVHNENFEGR